METSAASSEAEDSLRMKTRKLLLPENLQARAEVQRSRNLPCQSCHLSMMPFALYAGLVAFVTSALSSYLSSQITTLEKQYGWSSGQIGILVSINEVGYLTSILAITYFTRQSHIPRVLAICCFLFGVGAIICALPHFVLSTGRQQKSTWSLTAHADDMNTSSLCMSSERNTSKYAGVDTCSKSNTDHVNQAKTVAFALIASGMFLQGFANSPRVPLTLTYIDDNVQSSQTVLYSAITSSMMMLGYTLAYSMGAVFSRIHVSLKDTLMTPEDPRWIGAWWLGFVVKGTVAVVIPIPLWFFPRRLSTTQALERRTQLPEHPGEIKPSLSTQVKDIPATTLRLLTNHVYTLLVLGIGLKALRTAGYAAFNPKYMEVHFSLTASEANLFGGVSASSAIIVSVILNGILISRLKLQFKGLLRMTLLCETISSILFLLGMTISCPQPSIRGLDIMSIQSTTVDVVTTNITLECSSSCDCHGVRYDPVCGQDGLTYFSPCHAGCSFQFDKGYSGCRCISTTTVSPTKDLLPEIVPGMCSSRCSSYLLFTILQFLAWFTAAVSMLCLPLAIIRTVNHRDKSFATGVSRFTDSLIGWFLGPILFGNVTDTTCRLWHKSCGVKGACALYDIADLRIKYHLVDVIISFAYIIVFFGAYVCKMRSLSSRPTSDVLAVDGSQICVGEHEGAKCRDVAI